MRTNLVYIILTSILLITHACGPSASEKEEARVRRSKTPNPIAWDTISVAKVEPFSSKGVKASASFTLNFIVPMKYEVPDILNKIQQELSIIVLDSHANIDFRTKSDKYILDYLNNYKTAVNSQLELWHKINGGAKYFNYETKLSTDVLYNEANFISYQIKTEELKGDTIETIIVKNLLFDLTNGALLSEKNIFKEDALEKLNKLIIEAILKNNETKSVDELQKKGYWGITDIAANGNFYINNKGITYNFNPDEYADAELGIITAFIDYDDIENLVKDSSPITALIYD